MRVKYIKKINKLILKKIRLDLTNYCSRLADLYKRRTTHKRLKPLPGQLRFTKEDALRMIAKKEGAEKMEERRKERNHLLKLWRPERDAILA